MRQLAAGPAAGVQELTLGMDTIAYDARELRFAPVSPWQHNRWQIIGVSSVFVVQAGLIAALLLQRSRRRRAEAEARTLGGRLITAYEDEGRRLARELHDDITQRLAGLSIEAAALPRLGEPAASAAVPAASQLRTSSCGLHCTCHSRLLGH